MENYDDRVTLLTIQGKDRPGVTASLTEVLAKYDANILDIGQAGIHDRLSLGILFEVSDLDIVDNLLKDLLFRAYELDVKIEFSKIEYRDYLNWVEQKGKKRYIVTLLGGKLNAKQISSVTSVISDEGLNIDYIRRLTGRVPLGDNSMIYTKTQSSIQLSVRGTIEDKDSLTSQFLDLSRKLDLDISFQEDSIYRRNRRLICFDMDSTLIQAEVIDEVAARAGLGDKVKAITESAMRGEIDFNESFKRRVAMLKGVTEKELNDIADNLPFTDGVERLFETLNKVGMKTAILSGGFTYFGERLKSKFDIDYLVANRLEIVDGVLTGRFIGEIVNGEMKAKSLKMIAEREGISLKQVIAVGDGANDLPMLRVAGLGIAFNSKPKVRDSAKQAIDIVGLDGILYLLGFNDSDID